MTNDCNCRKCADSRTEKVRHKAPTINEVADNFALYGLNKRAAHLSNLDAELENEIASGTDSLRRHVRLMGLRRKMVGIHHALRKAKR